jgi:hypothetical protein
MKLINVADLKPITSVDALQENMIGRIIEMLNQLITKHNVSPYTVVGMLDFIRFEYIAANRDDDEDLA